MMVADIRAGPMMMTGDGNTQDAGGYRITVIRYHHLRSHNSREKRILNLKSIRGWM